jgi:hypothetical protein
VSDGLPEPRLYPYSVCTEDGRVLEAQLHLCRAWGDSYGEVKGVIAWKDSESQEEAE